MVAETNDVWYWNHPNIDYWVSQQSLVYIKHSPVTGWPAGVILIIRWRNMACSAPQGHETQRAACCLLHLAPGFHTCLFLMEALCNFSPKYELTLAKAWRQNYFHVSLSVCLSGPCFHKLFWSVKACYVLRSSRSKCVNHLSDIAQEWAEGELCVVVSLSGLDWMSRHVSGMTSWSFTETLTAAALKK